MCRRGACLASESSSIPIRGPKPLSVKGALRRWKTYRGNGHNFSQPLTGEKNEVKKEKKIQSVLEASSSSSRSLPPSLPPPQPTRISSGFPDNLLEPPLYSWVERDSVRANCFARGYNILSLPGQLSNQDFSTGSPVYWPSGHQLPFWQKLN